MLFAPRSLPQDGGSEVVCWSEWVDQNELIKSFEYTELIHGYWITYLVRDFSKTRRHWFPRINSSHYRTNTQTWYLRVGWHDRNLWGSRPSHFHDVWGVLLKSWEVIFLVTNRHRFHTMLFSLAFIADFSLLPWKAFYQVTVHEARKRKETSLTQVHAHSDSSRYNPRSSWLSSCLCLFVNKRKKYGTHLFHWFIPMRSLPNQPCQSQYRVHKKNAYTHLHVLGWQFVGSSSLLTYFLRWHTNKSHPQAPRISSISLFDPFSKQRISNATKLNRQATQPCEKSSLTVLALPSSHRSFEKLI